MFKKFTNQAISSPPNPLKSHSFDGDGAQTTHPNPQIVTPLSIQSTTPLRGRSLYAQSNFQLLDFATGTEPLCSVKHTALGKNIYFTANLNA